MIKLKQVTKSEQDETTWDKMIRGDLAYHRDYGLLLKTSPQWAYCFGTGYSIESGYLTEPMRPVIGQLNWKYK